MRVVLSMPGDGQSNQYIINALQDEGHEVVFIDHRSHIEAAVKQLPAIMKAYDPDLFLCLYLVDGETYPGEYIDKLKTHHPSTQYAAWLFDITINGEYAYKSRKFIELLKHYDYFFTVAESDVKKFEAQGINASWVPEGFSKYAHTHEFDYDKEFDVSFIGQFGHQFVHGDRLKYLDMIANMNIEPIFYGFASSITPNVERYYAHRPTLNDIEHCRVVAKSKINLCHSGWANTNKYVSARNYRVSACGGFMLCNDGKGVRSLWEPDKEVVLYKDLQDCKDKIKYFLKNEKERIEIAKAGQKRTLENYSFNNSIKKIADIVC